MAQADSGFFDSAVAFAPGSARNDRGVRRSRGAASLFPGGERLARCGIHRHRDFFLHCNRQATYDIRQGISEGNGGTDVASGSGSVAVAATGRNAFGLQEYTVTITFSTITLVPGESWFSLEPQCLNTLDGSCTVFRQFASNTTQETNAVNGGWQPDNEMFLNSGYFAATYANWCDAAFGLNTQQCDWLSFGLVGELQ